MVPGRHAAECVYATERAGASGAKQDDAAAAAQEQRHAKGGEVECGVVGREEERMMGEGGRRRGR